MALLIKLMDFTAILHIPSKSPNRTILPLFSTAMQRLPYCRVELPSSLPSGVQYLKKQCCKMSYIQISYLPKRKAQVWFCMVGHRQPHRCGLSDIDTSAHLNNQCVEQKFLHLWIPKPNQEVKLILVINHPEWHKHHSRWLFWRWPFWSCQQHFASCARTECWNIWGILPTKHFPAMCFIDCIN